MKTFFTVAFAVTMFALAGHAKADDTPKLKGKWEISKTEAEAPVGAIVEFEKDGKMNVVATLDGNEVKFEGTYKLDGKKLAIKLERGDQKIEKDFTITFKGDDGLEMEDEDKKVTTLKKKK